MRIYPMPTTCPACNSHLRVQTLVCANPQCRTQVRGEFEANEFALLPPEQLEFLRLYIKVRGNLKDVERIMGVSYPTVRAKMEQLLRTLGYEVDEPPPDTKDAERSEAVQRERAEILVALERGDLSPEEAAVRLRALVKR